MCAVLYVFGTVLCVLCFMLRYEILVDTYSQCVCVCV